jgi:hypothetical protein
MVGGFEEALDVLDAVELFDSASSIVSGGMGSRAVGETFTKGAAESGADVIAGVGMPGAADGQEAMQNLQRKMMDNSWAGGVSMWVKVKYKSCEACAWYRPDALLMSIISGVSDLYEWVEHEAPWYQCTIGSTTPQVNPVTGTTTPPIAGKGVYANKAHAKRYQRACEERAKADAIQK